MAQATPTFRAPSRYVTVASPGGRVPKGRRLPPDACPLGSGRLHFVLSLLHASSVLFLTFLIWGLEGCGVGMPGAWRPPRGTEAGCGCGRLSRSPKPGQRTRRGRGPRKQRQGLPAARVPSSPDSRPLRGQSSAGRAVPAPPSARTRHPARERAQRLEMAVKEKEGPREPSFSVLLVSGRPAYESGAAGASLGCHIWRSIIVGCGVGEIVWPVPWNKGRNQGGLQDSPRNAP